MKKKTGTTLYTYIYIYIDIQNTFIHICIHSKPFPIRISDRIPPVLGFGACSLGFEGFRALGGFRLPML